LRMRNEPSDAPGRQNEVQPAFLRVEGVEAIRARSLH